MMLQGLAAGLGAGVGGDTAPTVDSQPRVSKWDALSDGGLGAGDDKWAALYEGRPTLQPKVTAEYEDPAGAATDVPAEDPADMDVETNIDAQTNPESHTFSIDDLTDADLASLYDRGAKASFAAAKKRNPSAFAAGGVA